MAIAFVSAADGGFTNSTVHTFNFTVAGGANNMALVSIAFGGADDLVSVTVATGGAAVLLIKQTPAGVSGYNHYLYGVPTPSAGSRAVTITTTGSHLILAGAAEYTGIPSVVADATNTQSPGGSSLTFASLVTPVAANCWAFTNIGNNGQVPISAGTGSTIRAYDSSFGTWMIVDSNGTVAAGSPYSMGVSTPSGAGWDSCSVTLAPSGGSGGGVVLTDLERLTRGIGRGMPGRVLGYPMSMADRFERDYHRRLREAARSTLRKAA